MRILFAVFGTRPHIYPLVPLAWAFRAAGHEVRLASTPGWAADVAGTGLPAVPVGGSPRVSVALRDALAESMFGQGPWPPNWPADLAALDREQLAYLEMAGRYLVAAAAAMVDELAGFARSWAPHLVVYDSFSYAGPAAAAAIGAPAVRHLGGPDSAQRLEFLAPTPEPLPEYAALFDRFGVEVLTDPASTVDPTPPSLRVVAPPGLLGMRYIPYNGPGLAPGGLAGYRSRPRVCVTWGHTISSAVGAAGARPFHQAVAAATELGLDCVVAAPAAELDRLPGSVRALASVPLHLVLPHCDAVVHQGGDGTALTAATAALPQLAIAASPEADLCAGRLAASGVGIRLHDSDLRAEPGGLIRDALDRLLSTPAYAAAATRLRAEIESQPAPADVVEQLVTIAGG